MDRNYLDRIRKSLELWRDKHEILDAAWDLFHTVESLQREVVRLKIELADFEASRDRNAVAQRDYDELYKEGE